MATLAKSTPAQVGVEVKTDPQPCDLNALPAYGEVLTDDKLNNLFNCRSHGSHSGYLLTIGPDGTRAWTGNAVLQPEPAPQGISQAIIDEILATPAHVETTPSPTTVPTDAKFSPELKAFCVEQRATYLRFNEDQIRNDVPEAEIENPDCTKGWQTFRTEAEASASEYLKVRGLTGNCLEEYTKRITELYVGMRVDENRFGSFRGGGEETWGSVYRDLTADMYHHLRQVGETVSPDNPFLLLDRHQIHWPNG